MSQDNKNQDIEDVKQIQTELKGLGYYKGPVDGIATTSNGAPSETLQGFNGFVSEFQKLANANGQDTGAPGYGPKVEQAMAAGRPEGKINLPQGMTQDRAEALYKAAAEMDKATMTKMPETVISKEDEALFEQQVARAIAYERVGVKIENAEMVRLSQHPDPNVSLKSIHDKEEDFINNYTSLPASQTVTPKVGDSRSAEDIQRSQEALDRYAAANPPSSGHQYEVRRTYQSEDDIRQDQQVAIANRIGEKFDAPYFSDAKNLSKEEGTLLTSNRNLPTGQLKALYEKATSPEGFGKVPYDRANPQPALEQATRNTGAQWQMRDTGVLADDFGGPYAVATFKDQKQMQDTANDLASGGIGALAGKVDGKPAIFLTGEELDKIKPETLGVVKSFADTTPKPETPNIAPVAAPAMGNTMTGPTPQMAP